MCVSSLRVSGAGGGSEEEAIVLSLKNKPGHHDWRDLERSLFLKRDQADGGATV